MGDGALSSGRRGQADGKSWSAALERRVLRFVRDRAIFRPGEHVLAAVSGGPDSTALLVVLSRLASKLGITLTAAHFGHGLRGPSAARRERSYVEALCCQVGVPLRTGAGDTKAHARAQRLSKEEAARELRYAFLAEVAAAAGCTVVATGHTADDQVETVLLHIIRGSGLAGLAGMAPRGPWPLPDRAGRPAYPPDRQVRRAGLEVVRPLLCLRREETARYCREDGLEPVADPSNVSPVFLRNRVRLELLPLLRRYNPRIDSALLRLTEATRADLSVLEGMAADALSEGDGGQSAVLSRDRLAGLPEGLRRHALRLALRRVLGDLRDVHHDHIEALLAGLARGAGYHLDLPRGLRFDVGYEEATLSLEQPAPSSRPAPLPPEASLAVPGLTSWGPWMVEVETAAPLSAEPPPTDPWQAWLDADVTGQDLRVRSRRPGDRFQPLGLTGEKKLQDFFVDARVPRAERDAVPLVYGGPGIVWVVGHRIDERARITDATRRVLRLRSPPPPNGIKLNNLLMADVCGNMALGGPPCCRLAIKSIRNCRG
jgi:tRNA(Ile)-lysidine synthase